MAYFLDPTGELYWYADDGSQDAFKKPGLVPATDAQVQAIQNPSLTQAQVEAQYVAAAQNVLDATAQTRGYDGILSLCSYATSTNATFQAEGQAGVQWRDAVWAKAYAVLAQVQAGTLAQPDVPTFLTMLPAIIWPAASPA